MVSVGRSETSQVGNGAEVLELVGVDNATNCPDHAVVDLEGKNAHDPSLGIVEDDPGFAVDENWFGRYPYSGRLFE